ncbi:MULTISPECIES: hypothetical protein [unclassified Roseovarius]|uniref:hypothetical protein n=1 Tax=unclassified Roseovarius TaxID=2614913 RepID=UPI00273F01FA|nr:MULTISPECIES: hypothetical protein [unclassified Roseovarius]
MPLQNRVLPTGEIITASWRGGFMGNRGILHDDNRRLKTARWTHPHWVTCVLRYKDWHREVMTPRHYTELFFLDESSALAAGHRPCGLCRRADYTAFRRAWATAHRAQDLDHDDRMLHAARVDRTRRHKRYEAEIDTLPDGTFLWHEGAAHLLWAQHLIRFDAGRYIAALPRPASGRVTVLTPKPTVAAMLAGYRPALHATAERLLEARSNR